MLVETVDVRLSLNDIGFEVSVIARLNVRGNIGPYDGVWFADSRRVVCQIGA